jgi:glyoxalase family protein
MVHRVVFRVGSDESLAFWRERVGGALDGDSLVFADPEGLALELTVDRSGDEPLAARPPDIPVEHARRGFDAVRAYGDPGRSRPFRVEGLGFAPGFEARGEGRGGLYLYDPVPTERGIPGAGTVHHVAWASPPGDHEAWRERALAAGASPTPVIDRFYFRSIYFREPSGILFEIATIGPGFAVDEPAESLGERLSLPPRFEPLREQVERTLTPLPSTRRVEIGA